MSSSVRRERFVGAAIALLAVTCAPVWSQDKPFDNDYYAVQSSAYLIQTLKNVTNLHVQPGLAKLRERNYVSAYGEFRFTLDSFPNHPLGLDRMVQLCEAWRDRKVCNESALNEMFQRAIAKNPGIATTYELQGIYQLRSKRSKLALESFNKALEINPNSINAHYNLGLAYVESRDYALANEHAQAAYALGAPLPGLRRKLEQAGQWKPIDNPLGNAPAKPEPSAESSGGK